MEMEQFFLFLAPLFYKLVFMSAAAGCIGAVILFIRRLADCKVAPYWKYVMWLPVLAALFIPYRPQSGMALLGRAEQLQNISYYEAYETSRREYESSLEEYQRGNEGTRADTHIGEKQEAAVHTLVPSQETQVAALQRETAGLYVKTLIFDRLLPLLWFAGMAAAFLIWGIGRRRLAVRLKKSRIETNPRHTVLLEKCKSALKVNGRVEPVTQEYLQTPALTGVFRPKILLPGYVNEMKEQEIEYILLHELAHLKRFDTVMNNLLLALRAVYWFNPFLWYCFRRIRQDIELANDAYVLRHIGGENSREYSRSLVEVLGRSSRLSTIPKLLCMTDGKKNMERRIRMIQLGDTFRKHKILIGIVSLAIICAVSVLFLTSPASENTQPLLEEPYNAKEVKSIGYAEYVSEYEGYLDEINISNSYDKFGYPTKCVAKAYDYDKDETLDRLYRRLTENGKIIELHFGDGTILPLTETEDMWQAEIPYVYDVTKDGQPEIVYVGSHDSSTDPEGESEIIIYRKKDGDWQPMKVMDDYPGYENSIEYDFYLKDYEVDTEQNTYIVELQRDKGSSIFPDFETTVNIMEGSDNWLFIEELQNRKENQSEVTSLGGTAYNLQPFKSGGNDFLAAFIKVGGKFNNLRIIAFMQYDETQDALICRKMYLWEGTHQAFWKTRVWESAQWNWDR